MVKEISLNGKFHDCHVLVDSEDYDYLSHFNWYGHKGKRGNIYARGYVNGHKVYMHRLIMNDPKGHQVDHRNGTGMDNRRVNLRIATGSQNNANTVNKRKNLTKLTGVYYLPRRNKKYQAQIAINKKRITIGYFNTALEASRARDKYATRLHGEFARLNNV